MERISEICVDRYRTGKYASARFVMHPATWWQVQVQATTPPEAGGTLPWQEKIPELLSLPVVVQDDLPAGEWRLVDADGLILDAGHLDGAAG